MQKAATQAPPIPMLFPIAPLDAGNARVGPIVRLGPAVVSPIHTSPRRNQNPVLIQRGPASPAESTSSVSSNETCSKLYFSRESNASTSSSLAPWSSPTTSPCSPDPMISPARTSQPKTIKRSAQDTLRRINVAHGERLNALAKQSFNMLKPSSHPPVVRRKRSLSGTWRLSGAACIERVAEGMSKPVGNSKMTSKSVNIEEWWANLDEELKQRSSPPEAELQHAFGAGETAKIVDNQEEWHNRSDPRHRNRQNLAKIIYDYTEWCWVLRALSLTLQATRTVEVSDTHEMIMYYGELAISIAFDAEIVLRIFASLPNWRYFFWRGRNNINLFLVIGTSTIRIPAIKNSAVYPWITVLHLMRFYRVILVVPRMKPLLLTVFGNVYGLTNMTLFLITINYVATLFTVQLFRGDFAEGKEVDFAHLYNTLLCVYQVFSIENWTDVLY